MKTILIAPWARQMRVEGKLHPKDYPWWDELVELLRADYQIMQVGTAKERRVSGVDSMLIDPPLDHLLYHVQQCETWISVDSFLQHFCWYHGKPGIVLFGQSDPNIFGHPENTNLLRNRSFLREKQFWLWEQAEMVEEAFVTPHEVLDAVKHIVANNKPK